jgi:hypothetical protein
MVFHCSPPWKVGNLFFLYPIIPVTPNPAKRRIRRCYYNAFIIKNWYNQIKAHTKKGVVESEKTGKNQNSSRDSHCLADLCRHNVLPSSLQPAENEVVGQVDSCVCQI